jgi:hypothetical protein
VDDLGPLTTLHLSSLGLWGCRGITDFTPIAAMPELAFLDLENTSIRDLMPIASLSKLNILWLWHCTDVDDLAPLRSLRNLQSLFIKDVTPGIDLAPLAGNSRLTEVISPK